MIIGSQKSMEEMRKKHNKHVQHLNSLIDLLRNKTKKVTEDCLKLRQNTATFHISSCIEDFIEFDYVDSESEMVELQCLNPLKILQLEEKKI